MAATVPPPDGPWCMAATETNTAGSADCGCDDSPDGSLDLAVVMYVGVVEHHLPPAAETGRSDRPRT